MHLNGDPEGADALGRVLADRCSAQLLAVRKGTILLAKGVQWLHCTLLVYDVTVGCDSAGVRVG